MNSDKNTLRLLGAAFMNEDGSDRKLLEKVNAGGIENMEWNPDGSKIAFVTWVLRSDGFDREIYTGVTSLSKIG